MKKIVGLIMAVTIALSLNACTFTGQSETSNMVDESVSVDQEAAEEASTQSIEAVK